METRIATPEDILELTRIEIESKRASIPDLVDITEIDFAQRRHRWLTYFRCESPASAKPERRVLIATVDGTPLGYIAGHPTTRYSMEAEIQSFYVLREHQRKGIGSALLAELFDWFVSIPLSRLCVGVAVENPYRAFYLKRGARYLNEHWLFWDDIHSIGRKRA